MCICVGRCVIVFAGEEAGVAGRPDEACGGDQVRNHRGSEWQPFLTKAGMQKVTHIAFWLYFLGGDG
jgi:hypothetical protein